jgi:hypothetical protein
MTLAELLDKLKLIPAPTRQGVLSLFIDRIDIPNGPQTMAFLFQADKFCKTGQEKAAFSVLLNFAGGAGALRGFPNLSRTLLAYQLGLRVLDSTRIQQTGFGLCGPTALAVDVLRSDPEAFVKCATELAITATCTLRGRSIAPGADIRNYQPPNSIPQADFLMLTSLRSSDEVLLATTETATYGGTDGATLFEWCVACGYPRVLLITCPMAANFELTNPMGTLKSVAKAVLPGVSKTLGLDIYKKQYLRCHPDSAGDFGIGGIDVGNKLQVLRMIPFYLGMGWKVFMQGEARIATAAQKFDEIEARNQQMRAALGPNYRATDAVRGSLTEMAARAPEPHWMFVEHLWIHPENDKVGIYVHSWGKSHTHPGIPIDLFLNNFEGMIACSPLPAPVLPAHRHRSGSTIIGPIPPPPSNGAQRPRSGSFS